MLLLAFAPLAHAEDPTFVGTKTAEEAAKPETHLTANAGGTFTVGNSESVTFNAGIDLSHKWTSNQLGIVGGAALGFGATDTNADGFLASDERCIGVGPCAATAERYALDGRYDRFVSDKSSLYVLVGGFHDKFAGFELRVHGQLGYARHLVDNDRTHLKVEAGVDIANEAYVEGVTPASARLIAAQVAAAFDHKFNDNVGFSDALTLYEPVLTQPDGSPFAPHFTDLRINNVATLSSKVSDKLSISLTDTLAWRNEPIAAPDGITDSRSPIDNTVAVALVASLL
jgi:hypothetical protein